MLACLALLLLVKEDARVRGMHRTLPVLGKREYRLGGLVFAASRLYFVMAVWYINRFGDGAMINRFDNYISDKRLGLASMFKTILVNPAYVFPPDRGGGQDSFLSGNAAAPWDFCPDDEEQWQRRRCSSLC